MIATIVTIMMLSITVEFRSFIVFFGPRPRHIEIRHRVKTTSTINLFGFETQIENSKIEIMETDRKDRAALGVVLSGSDASVAAKFRSV